MAAQIYHLSNGVRVVIDEVPHTQTAAVGMYFTVGTRNEDKKNNGVAHFLEHMMFKGTKKRGVGQIDREAADMGAQANAHTGHESTCYHMTGMASDTPAMIDILSDMVCHATLSKKEMDIERGAVISEIRQHKDDLDSSIFYEALKAAYPGQSASAAILGSEKNIKSMSQKTLKDFKDKHYHAGNLIVSVAGNVKAQDVLQTLEETLKDLPSGAPSVSKRAVYKGDSTHQNAKSEHIHLVLQFNSCAAGDPQSLPMDVLGDILGSGPTSRLFQAVREKRGLVYEISAMNSPDIDDGVFQIYLQSSRKNLKLAVPLICDEIRKAAQEGFTAAELKRAKASWRTFFAISADSMDGRMLRAAEDLHYFGRIPAMEERLREVDEKVTVESVQAAAREIFSHSPSVVTIGPGKWPVNPDEVARALSL